MKKLATKLTPAIKDWIKEEFGSDYYSDKVTNLLFHFPNYKNENGFLINNHLNDGFADYTEVSEQEFLAEFGKSKVLFQYLYDGRWVDLNCQKNYRIKPTPDYTKEIEALQSKAKENGMTVTINFEKL